MIRRLRIPTKVAFMLRRDEPSVGRVVEESVSTQCEITQCDAA